MYHNRLESPRNGRWTRHFNPFSPSQAERPKAICCGVCLGAAVAAHQIVYANAGVNAAKYEGVCVGGRLRLDSKVSGNREISPTLVHAECGRVEMGWLRSSIQICYAYTPPLKIVLVAPKRLKSFFCEFNELLFKFYGRC